MAKPYLFKRRSYSMYYVLHISNSNSTCFQWGWSAIGTLRIFMFNKCLSVEINLHGINKQVKLTSTEVVGRSELFSDGTKVENSGEICSNGLTTVRIMKQH